jgi:hypothetical protein
LKVLSPAITGSTHATTRRHSGELAPALAFRHAFRFTAIRFIRPWARVLGANFPILIVSGFPRRIEAARGAIIFLGQSPSGCHSQKQSDYYQFVFHMFLPFWEHNRPVPSEEQGARDEARPERVKPNFKRDETAG